ncbi:hypothetical protein L1887_51577 [Cichorium endivia]|nr:hypothetical protein L1887_51577 [Cichorium endivia]
MMMERSKKDCIARDPKFCLLPPSFALRLPSQLLHLIFSLCLHFMSQQGQPDVLFSITCYDLGAMELGLRILCLSRRRRRGRCGSWRWRWCGCRFCARVHVHVDAVAAAVSIHARRMTQKPSPAARSIAAAAAESGLVGELVELGGESVELDVLREAGGSALELFAHLLERRPELTRLCRSGALGEPPSGADALLRVGHEPVVPHAGDGYGGEVPKRMGIDDAQHGREVEQLQQHRRRHEREDELQASARLGVRAGRADVGRYGHGRGGCAVRERRGRRERRQRRLGRTHGGAAECTAVHQRIRRECRRTQRVREPEQRMHQSDHHVGRHVVCVVEAADAEVEYVQRECANACPAQQHKPISSRRQPEEPRRTEEEAGHDDGARGEVVELFGDVLVARVEDGGPDPGVDADERMHNVDELERKRVGELFAEAEERIVVDAQVEQAKQHRQRLLRAEEADEDPLAVELHHLLLHGPQLGELGADECADALCTRGCRDGLLRSKGVDFGTCVVLDLVHALDGVVGDAVGAVVLAVVLARPACDAQDEGQTVRIHDAVIHAVAAQVGGA